MLSLRSLNVSSSEILKDIDLIIKIKELLYNQKFSIDGARKMLADPTSQEPIEVPSDNPKEMDLDLLIKIRTELKSILEELNK